MGKYIVTGGSRLNGEVRTQGAKNSVLPILAAVIINGKISILHDCPKIKDVYMAIEILKFLGCVVEWEGNSLIINSSNIINSYIPQELMIKMRSSVIFLGGILSRLKQAKCSYPGGCELGARPVNLHLKAFKNLGIEVIESAGYIICDAGNLKPTKIHLDFPSVGATENIMLVACNGKGRTVISNAAREPEIVDLQDFLNAMGANIRGAGTSKITINGVSEFNNVEWRIMPDRIAAATMLFAVAATGGDVLVNNVNISNIDSIISQLKDMGAILTTHTNSVRIISNGRLKCIDTVQTLPYPGFPTDAQPQLMSALSIANGSSIIKETIFENRFKAANELIIMGADITTNDRVAFIRGAKRLHGATVKSPDLRGGAALVIAAMTAEGISEIENIHYIERGYENFDGILNELGANIKRFD